jgi:hypothetical protein
VTAALDELAEREMQVLGHAKAVAGTMQERERQLRADGTFAESATIHAAYVALAAAPGGDTEALKRAVFLNWYRYAEPSCFSGIDDLGPAATERAYAILADLFVRGAIDDEFAAMLGWYQATGYDIGGYPGDDGRWHECATPAMRNHLRSLDGQAHKSHPFARDDLERRGQMGVYWISIAFRPD